MGQLAALLEGLVDKMERAAALDRPADVGQRLSGRIPDGFVKDALSGTQIGHPVHPLAVTVPIGAFVAASFLDATGGDPAASRRLVGLGLVTAVPAALAGASDWHDLEGGERRVGVVHAIGNSLGLTLLAASWLARHSGGRGKVRALAGLGLIGASGWLGGHLTYAQGAGVDTTAFQRPATEWTDACPETELSDGQPHALDVAGMAVVVVRDRGAVRALANRCTHRGAPLSDGDVDGGCIECPWHGSRFDLVTGQVERGPATRPAPTFEVRVRDGVMQVRRSEVRALRLNPTD